MEKKSLSQQTADRLYTMIVVEGTACPPGKSCPTSWTCHGSWASAAPPCGRPSTSLAVPGSVGGPPGPGHLRRPPKWPRSTTSAFPAWTRCSGELRDLFELRAIFEPSGCPSGLPAGHAGGAGRDPRLRRGAWSQCIRPGPGPHRRLTGSSTPPSSAPPTTSFMMRLLPMINQAVAAAIVSGQHKDQLAEDTLPGPRPAAWTSSAKRDADGAAHAMAIHMHHSIDVMGLEE